LLKKYTTILITFLLIFGFSAPSFAAAEDYFAGGGLDDGTTSEIHWQDVDDTNLSIREVNFDPVEMSVLNDGFDYFGFVWVRSGGNWYQIDGSLSGSGGSGGPADGNSSSYEITITRTVNSVLVTAKLSILNNRAKWSVETSAPVERIAVLGDIGSDGSEVWYQKSSNVWWSNDGGTDSGTDPLLRFETSTNGLLRQQHSMPADGLTGTGFAGTQSNELDNAPGGLSDQVIALSGETVSDFYLCVSIFSYNRLSSFADVTARNAYIDNLNVESCSESSTIFSWVGAQSISCPDANPWFEQELGFANKVTPLGMSSTNLVGRNISQSNLLNLYTDGVYFDAESKTVSTATEVLPIYGCNDKLLKAKIGKPIQFIVGGFTLQSEARGYIKGASNNWYDLNGVTLHPDNAAFMHTVKFTKPGRYIVVITEQPDTSRGLIPTYGVRSIRFVINIK
jgi:hypothetical protein